MLQISILCKTSIMNTLRAWIMVIPRVITLMFSVACLCNFSEIQYIMVPQRELEWIWRTLSVSANRRRASYMFSRWYVLLYMQNMFVFCFCFLLLAKLDNEHSCFLSIQVSALFKMLFLVLVEIIFCYVVKYFTIYLWRTFILTLFATLLKKHKNYRDLLVPVDSLACLQW